MDMSTVKDRKLLDDVRDVMRLGHYSIHTERTYDPSKDPRSNAVRRHHVDPSVINKAIRAASGKAGLVKKVSAHTLCVAALQPTCYSAETTSEPSRRCSAITMSRPPWFIPMSFSRAGRGFQVPWTILRYQLKYNPLPWDLTLGFLRQYLSEIK